MHASAFGAELTRARINTINATHGVQFAKIDMDCSITASGPIQELQVGRAAQQFQLFGRQADVGIEKF